MRELRTLAAVPPGGVIGMAAGLLLACADALLTARPVIGGMAGKLGAVLPALVVMLVPAGAVAGAVLALAAAAVVRAGRWLAVAAGALLAAVWVAGVLAVGGEWGWGSTGTALQLTPLEVVALSAVAVVSLAALGLVATVLVRRRTALSRGIGGTCAVAWITAVVAVALGAGGGSLPATIAAPAGGRPNVLLVVVDTMRADHMSCYGYSRQTTPQIDALAAEGTLYERAVSPASWTLPSHASLFTGLPSSAHGCTWAHLELDEDLVTVAELLNRAGYQTLGLSANRFLRRGTGFAQGFETFDNPATERSRVVRLLGNLASRAGLLSLVDLDAGSDASILHRQLARWLRTRYDPSRPFFIFLNYLEPHAPYAPPSRELVFTTRAVQRRWARREQFTLLNRHSFTGGRVLSAGDIDELTALYDEEIRYVDGRIGELIALLRRSSLLDDTLVAITADHGEHLGEHGMMEHQYSVYEPLVRVPLIVRYPSRLAVGRNRSLVQSHDLFATVLEAAGVPWRRTEAHTTRSLLSAASDGDRVVVSEYLYPCISTLARQQQAMRRVGSFDASRFLRRLRAVRVGDLKLVRASQGAAELYDLAVDPLERHDLAAEQPQRVAALDRALDAWLAGFEHYRPRPYTPRAEADALRRQHDALRGLGYLQ